MVKRVAMELRVCLSADLHRNFFRVWRKLKPVEKLDRREEFDNAGPDDVWMETSFRPSSEPERSAWKAIPDLSTIQDSGWIFMGIGERRLLLYKSPGDSRVAALSALYFISVLFAEARAFFPISDSPDVSFASLQCCQFFPSTSCSYLIPHLAW